FSLWCSYIFFFQAEDGIRNFHVTGVQTCALPISLFGELREEFLPILLLLTYAAEDALDFRHGERHEHRLVGREQKLGLQQLEEQVLDELSLSPELCDQVG